MTQKSGATSYLGCIRDKSPEICPQLGLAVHLLVRYTIQKVLFDKFMYAGDGGLELVTTLVHSRLGNGPITVGWDHHGSTIDRARVLDVAGMGPHVLLVLEGEPVRSATDEPLCPWTAGSLA